MVHRLIQTISLKIFLPLAGGERLLTITFIIFAIVSLILIFIYIGHNGYALLVQRIIDAQDKLDKHLETESKIHIAPKQEKS